MMHPKKYFSLLSITLLMVGAPYSLVKGMEESKVLRVVEQTEVCTICQQDLPTATTDAHGSITLSCTHTTHKSCLEKYYRSLLISQNEENLSCPQCRGALTEQDRNALNLDIDLDDIGAFFKAHVTSPSVEPALALLNQVIAQFLRSPEAASRLAFFTNLSEEATQDLINIILHEILPITRNSIESGLLQEKLSRIYNERVHADLMQCLAHLVRTTNITPHMIMAVHQQLLHRMEPRVRPILSPYMKAAAIGLLQSLPILETYNTDDLSNNLFVQWLEHLKTLDLFSPALQAAMQQLNGSFPLPTNEIVLTILQASTHALRLRIDRPELMLHVLNAAFPLTLSPDSLRETIQVLRDVIAESMQGQNLFRYENGALYPTEALKRALGQIFHLNPQLQRSVSLCALNFLRLARQQIDGEMAQLSISLGLNPLQADGPVRLDDAGNQFVQNALNGLRSLNADHIAAAVARELYSSVHAQIAADQGHASLRSLVRELPLRHIAGQVAAGIGDELAAVARNARQEVRATIARNQVYCVAFACITLAVFVHYLNLFNTHAR